MSRHHIFTFQLSVLAILLICVISEGKSPATVMPHLFNAFLSLNYIEAIKVKCIKICHFLWFAINISYG